MRAGGDFNENTDLRCTWHRFADIRLHPLSRCRGRGQQGRRHRRVGGGRLFSRATAGGTGLDRCAYWRSLLRSRSGDPRKIRGQGRGRPEKLLAQLETMVPREHREFVEKLLDEYGVPKLPAEEQVHSLQGWTMATARPLLDQALTRPKVKLIANALGTPPADVIEEVKASGRLIGALCGRVKHAIRHREAVWTLSLPKGGKAAAMPARSAVLYCGRRSSRRWRPRQCWPPVASAAVRKSLRR